MPNRPFIASLRDALAGIVHVVRTQRNARIHAVCALAVVVVGALLELSALDWALLWLAIGGVWSAEIGNTVVEAVVDLLSPELHPRARIAKDAAAGAVLVLGVTAILVGLCVLGPPLWGRLAAAA